MLCITKSHPPCPDAGSRGRLCPSPHASCTCLWEVRSNSIRPRRCPPWTWKRKVTWGRERWKKLLRFDSSPATFLIYGHCWRIYTPDLKVNISFVGLIVLHRERSKLEALLQKPLRRGNEAWHRHGDPQKIHDAFSMIAVHAWRKTKSTFIHRDMTKWTSLNVNTVWLTRIGLLIKQKYDTRITFLGLTFFSSDIDSQDCDWNVVLIGSHVLQNSRVQLSLEFAQKRRFKSWSKNANVRGHI